MASNVRIPTPLLGATGGKTSVTVEATTVREVLAELESQFPGINERLCDENGELRRFINIFVERENIRFLDGLETVISQGEEVSIVPAVAGG